MGKKRRREFQSSAVVPYWRPWERNKDVSDQDHEAKLSDISIEKNLIGEFVKFWISKSVKKWFSIISFHIYALGEAEDIKSENLVKKEAENDSKSLADPQDNLNPDLAESQDQDEGEKEAIK